VLNLFIINLLKKIWEILSETTKDSITGIMTGRLCTKLFAVSAVLIAKFLLSRLEPAQYFAVVVLKVKAATEADRINSAAGVMKDLVLEIGIETGKCMMLFATSAEKTARCRLNQLLENLFFAMIVLKEARAGAEEIQEKLWNR